MSLKVAKLIKTEAGENSNKFYSMRQIDSNTWEANWGRVGTPGRKMVYNMYDWDSKLREKIRGDYVDQTHLFSKPDPKQTGVDKIVIKDSLSSVLVNTLLKYAKETVTRNYVVTSEAVTEAMVKEAQSIIDSLVNQSEKRIDVENCNKLLLKLYHTLPRKMAKVKDFLLSSTNRTEFNKRLSEEQNLLDVMAGQVKVEPVVKPLDNKDQDILVSIGITISEPDDKDIDKVKSMMASDSRLLKRVYRVTHSPTRKHIEGKKCELQWHGSRNENWWNILKTGLKIRPANAIHTGSMFGSAQYFSTVFKKSMGYTSHHGSYWAKGNQDTAFLAVMEIFTGNKLVCTRHTSEFQSMTWNNLRKKGDYHSVHAPKGYDLRNDETMLYREDQSSIKYLVQISSQ